MKRIAIITATRAEYGQLFPLIRTVADDEELDLDLIVTGTHLSEKHGHTLDAIRADGYEIAHTVPILDEDNGPYGISATMANAMKGFAKCFSEDRPDIAVILGDRTEMLSVAAAALNERIPIAHIHGGEVTFGAVDDCIRHAITKMSILHFTSTSAYRKRVIQLGESPDRVFSVGALSVDNIRTQELMSGDEVRADIGIPSGGKYAVVTFHPVTMEDDTVSDQIDELCAAMKLRDDIFFVITGANADAGGNTPNQMLTGFADGCENAVFIHNLGMKRYLSSVRHAAFVLGNSSSGILEAPVLGTPSVNIGDRQKGRIMAKTVISCESGREAIGQAMAKALATEHRQSDIYGDGHAAEAIVKIIKQSLSDGISLKKGFYDIKESR